MKIFESLWMSPICQIFTAATSSCCLFVGFSALSFVFINWNAALLYWGDLDIDEYPIFLCLRKVLSGFWVVFLGSLSIFTLKSRPVGSAAFGWIQAENMALYTSDLQFILVLLSAVTLSINTNEPFHWQPYVLLACFHGGFFFTRERILWSSRPFDVVQLIIESFLCNNVPDCWLWHPLTFCFLSDRFILFFQPICGVLHLHCYVLGFHIDSFYQAAAKCQFNAWKQPQTFYLLHMSLCNKGKDHTWSSNCLSVKCPNTFEPLKTEVLCIKCT